MSKFDQIFAMHMWPMTVAQSDYVGCFILTPIITFLVICARMTINILNSSADLINAIKKSNFSSDSEEDKLEDW